MLWKEQTSTSDASLAPLSLARITGFTGRRSKATSQKCRSTRRTSALGATICRAYTWEPRGEPRSVGGASIWDTPCHSRVEWSVCCADPCAFCARDDERPSRGPELGSLESSNAPFADYAVSVVRGPVASRLPPSSLIAPDPRGSSCTLSLLRSFAPSTRPILIDRPRRRGTSASCVSRVRRRKLRSARELMDAHGSIEHCDEMVTWFFAAKVCALEPRDVGCEICSNRVPLVPTLPFPNFFVAEAIANLFMRYDLRRCDFTPVSAEKMDSRNFLLYL